jgi:hypothetical protein
MTTLSVIQLLPQNEKELDSFVRKIEQLLKAEVLTKEQLKDITSIPLKTLERLNSIK